MCGYTGNHQTGPGGTTTKAATWEEQHTTIRAASNSDSDSDSDSDSATQQEQQQQNARTEVQAATAREATRISQPRVHSCDYVPLHC